VWEDKGGTVNCLKSPKTLINSCLTRCSASLLSSIGVVITSVEGWWLTTRKVETVDSGVDEPPFVSRLRSMRPASSNIGSIILSYVVDDVLCPKRMISSTMAPTSLALCCGAKASPGLRLEWLFRGCTKQLEMHSVEVWPNRHQHQHLVGTRQAVTL
jgi:hypothetical protein